MVVHAKAAFITLSTVMGPLEFDLVATAVIEGPFAIGCWVSGFLRILKVVEMEVVLDQRVEVRCRVLAGEDSIDVLDLSRC